MSEFNLVQQAPRGPTKCYFCEDFNGPFIDTFRDDPSWGAVFICAPTETRSGCLGQMGHLVGLYTQNDVEHFEELIQQLRERLEEREAQIARAFSYIPGDPDIEPSPAGTVR